MAKDWLTSPMTSHYDTPGTFDKNLPVCHSRRRTVDSVLKVKLVLPSAQHMPKQVKKNYTHRKSNTLKLSNQNAEKSLSIAMFNVHILNQSTLQNTKSDRHHHLLAMRYINLRLTYLLTYLEATNDKYRKIPHTQI